MKENLSFYLSFLTLNGLILLSFNSQSQDFSYSADELYSDSANNSLTFEGNVSLNFEEFIFESDRAQLDEVTKTLELESLSFKVKNEFVGGEAKKAIASENKITLEEAKFSLCPCEEKIWWIEAEKVDLNIEKNNIFFNKGKLKVYDKTIFYFPKGSFPATGERRSGFLLPEISASNKSGTDISIPYYFNLAKNYDFTIEPRYISRRGEGGSSELRYLSNNYEGFFRTSFLNESKDESSFRWSTNFFHNAKIFEKYFLNINYSNLSDSLFLRDFGSSYSNSSHQLFVPQKMSISSFGKNYEFITKINAFKLTNPIGVSQFQEIPEIKLNFFYSYEGFDLNLKTNYQSYKKGGSFIDNSNTRVEKIKVEPEFLFYKKFFEMESMIKLNYILENFHLENSKKSRIYPKAEFKISSTLHRKGEGNLEILTPSISYIYTQNKNQLDLPNINSGIFLDSKNFSKNIISGDSYIPMRRDFLISTEYLLYRNNSKLNIYVSKLIGLGKRFLHTNNFNLNLPEPYQIKANYKDGKSFNFFGSITKDSDNKYDSFNAGLFKEFASENYLSLSFIWARDINAYILEKEEKRPINFLEVKNKFSINDRSTLYSKFNYDLENSNLSYSMIGIEYENPGLIIGLALIESNGLDWSKLINENTVNEYNQESFRIYFELKGLGSLGRKIDQYTRNNQYSDF